VINLEWKRITGNMPGKSTLPNRYPRLRANLACVASDDLQQMLNSEAEVNEQIEAEVKDLWNKKWARVGKHMENAGSQNYPVRLVICFTLAIANWYRAQLSRSTGRR
jgi:hypothetical protein